MFWFVYILRCANDSYYIGHTSNTEARLLRHKNRTGAQHTATYQPDDILYQEQLSSASKAGHEHAVTGTIPGVDV
jgi:putative endonuclease